MSQEERKEAKMPHKSKVQKEVDKIISARRKWLNKTTTNVPASLGTTMEVVSLSDLAEEIYERMRGLTSKEGQWVVDCHEFLPANVTCDHAGKACLINIIANAIEKYLGNRLITTTDNKEYLKKKGEKCIGIYLLES